MKSDSVEMRERKFRVWDTVYKKMFYPGECKFSIDFFGKLYDDDFTPSKYIGATRKLMEYIGIEDKTGKEIWEGDIIYAHNCKMTCAVVYKELEDRNGGTIMGFDLINKDTIEVIGNIYENPELLEINK